MSAASSDMEFEAYLTQYLRHVKHNGGVAKTLEKYEEILRRANKELPYGLLRSTTDELEDWVWIDGRAPKTLAAYKSILCGFYRFACDEWHMGEHRISFDPARHLPRVRIPPKAARPAQWNQVEDILTRAPEPVRTWFAIIAGSGLRCIDLSRLDREDCTPESMFVVGKGGRQREIMMHPRVWAVIEPMPPGPVARHPRTGQRATARKIMELGNYRLKKLGYKITMHKLRGYFATEVHEGAGGDVLVSQNQLGHQDPATTRIYVPVSRSKAAAAVASVRLPA